MTHCCHNRAFLLNFARDREGYRAKMREHLAEIMGTRRRYRLLDLERLCRRLGTDGLEEVGKILRATLEETLAKDQMKREPCWTESVAVGTRAYLERIQPLILSRRETEIIEEAPDRWVLKETQIPYRTEL